MCGMASRRRAVRPACRAWLLPVAVSLLATGCGRTAIERGPDAPASKPPLYPESDAPPTRDDSFAPEDTLPTQRDVPVPFDLPVREPPVATGDAATGLDAADSASEVARDVPSADLADAPAREVPEPPDVPLPRDIAGDPIKPWVDLGYSADAAALAELCARTGGRAIMQYCGIYFYGEFFDTCASTLTWCCYMNRPCQDIAVCACPNGGCFKPAYGCVGKYSGCTVGMDQTCNDDPVSSAIRGQCVEGGYCLCRDLVSNPTTGKCL